jgi:hypothetical protein
VTITIWVVGDAPDSKAHSASFALLAPNKGEESIPCKASLQIDGELSILNALFPRRRRWSVFAAW